jgi:hypothetical protein
MFRDKYRKTACGRHLSAGKKSIRKKKQIIVVISMGNKANGKNVVVFFLERTVFSSIRAGNKDEIRNGWYNKFCPHFH